MKTAGIIGGIGPEATLEYYRLIISSYRQRTGDDSYPPLIINSINLQTIVDLVTANNLPGLTAFLSVEIQRLSRAGADFGLLAANTPHIVFDALNRQSPIPLLSIVEVTCQAAQRMGLRRLGLLGTRFTMTGGFYHDIFSKAGITLAVPTPEEQDYVHDKYMNELVKGVFLPETKQGLLSVVQRLKQQHEIEGCILGGTELPLILGDAKDSPVPLLDTTRLHVEAIVARILS